MPPQTAGTVLMAQPVIMAVFSPIVGRLSDRTEPRLLATGGMAITAVGMIVFTRLHSNTGIGAIVGNLVLLGFGFALFSSPNMSAIMGAVEKKNYGIASGVVATMRLMGQMTSYDPSPPKRAAAGWRNTFTASWSRGVGSLLMITSWAPLSLAMAGNAAAG
jgi:MFS family permease